MEDAFVRECRDGGLRCGGEDAGEEAAGEGCGSFVGDDAGDDGGEGLCAVAAEFRLEAGLGDIEGVGGDGDDDTGDGAGGAVAEAQDFLVLVFTADAIAALGASVILHRKRRESICREMDSETQGRLSFRPLLCHCWGVLTVYSSLAPSWRSRSSPTKKQRKYHIPTRTRE